MHPVNIIVCLLVLLLILYAICGALRLLHPKLRRLNQLDRRVSDDCPYFRKDFHV